MDRGIAASWLVSRLFGVRSVDMSGGAFNHEDYHIHGIGEQISELIRDNEERGE